MKLCLLSKDINNCPFCDKEKMECHNDVTGCGFQKCEEIKTEETMDYIRKERWYEKYCKDSRPKKS